MDWTRTSFRSSLIPMVMADDARRYIAANQAACLLLRLPEDQIQRLSIDDLTPLENRAQVEALWEAFLRDGVQTGTFELLAPDGARLAVDYSATANIEPGRHLSILAFPPADRQVETPKAADPAPLLTAREREILGMIAAGGGSSWIAFRLGVAQSTVETHVRNCLQKLGARNRPHAIALGLRRGEIALDLDATP